MIAALPCDGQARDGRGIVVVVPGMTDLVVTPGMVVVDEVDVVVVETDVEVVAEVAVPGLAPTVRPTTTAPTPKSGTTTRHNFEASACFTLHNVQRTTLVLGSNHSKSVVESCDSSFRNRFVTEG
jgi:hypothetical protein